MLKKTNRRNFKLGKICLNLFNRTVSVRFTEGTFDFFKLLAILPELQRTSRTNCKDIYQGFSSQEKNLDPVGM